MIRKIKGRDAKVCPRRDLHSEHANTMGKPHARRLGLGPALATRAADEAGLVPAHNRDAACTTLLPIGFIMAEAARSVDEGAGLFNASQERCTLSSTGGKVAIGTRFHDAVSTAANPWHTQGVEYRLGIVPERHEPGPSGVSKRLGIKIDVSRRGGSYQTIVHVIVTPGLPKQHQEIDTASFSSSWHMAAHIDKSVTTSGQSGKSCPRIWFWCRPRG